jgi:GT2 family glycosyltransferase
VPDEWCTRSYKLQAIRNTNTGFAAGNNLGIKQAGGKYILLLNPDTKIESNTLEVMLDFMESHPKVGISGCKVVKPDGSLDLACRRKFPNPWNSFKRLFLFSNSDYNLTTTDENQPQEIDSVMGAFMLIRNFRNFADLETQKLPTSDFRLPNGNYLDEDFFMYGEDLNLCWRCKEAGFQVWYYPKTSITHFKGSSSSKVAFKALKWFHDAMWIFYRKHYAKKYPTVFNWLVFLGIYLRLSLLVVLNVFKSKPQVSK